MNNDLISFVSSFEGGDGLRVEESLGGGYVRLRVSEAERRQAKHDIRCVEDAVIELLRNSRDAGARHIYLSTSREGSVRTICVIDDGSGIPQNMHEKVFDARVTSKLDSMLMDRWGVHGRGMALYSISQNALEARVMTSIVGTGTSIRCSFDVSSITERADQSTWPTISPASGHHEVRGPKNIPRACVEFALEAKDICNVYVGSPSEIVATMRSLEGWTSEAADARELQQMAQRLGLEMSERTAHRIIKHEIAPLRNARSRVIGSARAQSLESSLAHERTLSLSKEDREELSRMMERDFETIAKRYYVVPVGKPRITSSKGCVRVVFEYLEDD